MAPPPAEPATRTRARGRRWILRVAVLFGACVLAIGGAELALRVHAAIRPAESDFVPEPVAPGNPTSLDLRGPRYFFAPDQLRVLAIGDSFTWGDRVSAHADTWPMRLEANLTARLGRPVGVVNLAQRGFTCVASARALETYGVPLQPDVVIYGFYLNDAFRNFPDGSYLIWDELWGRLLPEPAHSWWTEHSLLYTRLDSMRLAWKIRTDPGGWNTLYADNAVEWQQFRDGLRSMAQSAWHSKAPVIMLQFPDFSVQSLDTGAYQWEAIHHKAGAAAAEFGMHVIDLTPAYAAESERPSDWCATPTNCHPNERGHALAADVLADYLAEHLSAQDARAPENG